MSMVAKLMHEKSQETKKVNVNTQLDEEMLGRLDAVCKELGCGRSKFLLAALTDALLAVEGEMEGAVHGEEEGTGEEEPAPKRKR
jgi:metal-responsive CopG/Arc/MetJ family transcriptional regulator